MRQLMVLLFAALLSPAIRVLPARTAEIAGRAGWLSALVALPVILGLCWVLWRLIRPQEAGTGLGGALERAWGGALGRILLMAYLLWGLVLLAVSGRLYAQRLLSTGYRNTPLALFLVILFAVVLWMAWGKLSAFARAGEVFFLILCVALGAVLLFAAPHVEAENILPVWTEDVAPALFSALPVLNTVAYGIYGVFLTGSITRRESDKGRICRWTAAFCVLLTLLQLINLGNFGPGLVSRMEVPFFMMAKGIGLRGAFQRVESVVVALWVLSDLMFVGLLVFSLCEVSKRLFRLERGRAAAPFIVLLGLGGALLFPDAFHLEWFADTVVPVGNLTLAYGVPVLTLAVAYVRRQTKRKEHI